MGAWLVRMPDISKPANLPGTFRIDVAQIFP
jgi:hypothetical protein